MKTKFSTKVIVEIAIFAAIAVALDFIQGAFFRGIWANGGSLGIAMVPIFIICYRRGLLPGILCGLIVSIVQMLGGIQSVQAQTFDNDFQRAIFPFIQIMLDYVLAYTVVGFAGCFAGKYAKGKDLKAKLTWIIVGTLIGGFGKFLCHFVAGYFWLNMYNDPFMGVDDTSMLFSLVYNGTYCIPNMIICTGIMVIIAKFYPQLLTENEEEKEGKEEVVNE